MTCTSCLAPTDEGDAFCRRCGLALRNACPHCGQAVGRGSPFCTACGSPLAAPAPANRMVSPSRPPGFVASGERKFLTVMFADIVGSTALVEGLDPELSVAALAPGIQTMFTAVHTYGGTVNRVQGDGIMALFGAPVAHEDHAVRACLAGLMLVEEANKLGGPQVRVGLHSGLVVVRAINNDMAIAYEADGPTVHLAARMEQLCQAGTVRVSAATRTLAAGAILADSLGQVGVKGFSTPVESFVVRGIARSARADGEAAAVRRASFVDRTEQLAILRRAVGLCEAGSGQTVLITGPPGIGKSRLVQECIQSIVSNKWLVLRTECAPYHQNTTYYALRRLLRSWAALDEVEPATASRTLVTALRRLDPALIDQFAPLNSLLAMPVDDERWSTLDPPVRQRRITEAICELAAALARQQPIALVFEDLHWADSETIRVLQHMASRSAGQRCLILVTSREAHPALPSSLALDGLPRQHAERMIDVLLGPGRTLEMLKRQIRESTQGVPLFIQETVNSLVDAGDIVKASNGYVPRRRLNKLKIPPTLSTLLSSRIDQIDRVLKWVLQVASVIGNEVPLTVLARVLGRSEQNLTDDLVKLDNLDFLRPSDHRPEEVFAFRHALMRETAYESLLHDQRIVLHAAVAEAIEACFHQQIDNHVEALAQHAFLGELWQKALIYTRKSADNAFRNSALHDACRFLELALACVGNLPQDRTVLALTAELHVMLRMALWPLGSVAEANAHLDQAETIAEQIGDDYRLGQISIARTQILSSEGNLDDAVAAGLRARSRAAAVGDRALSLRADFVLAQAYQFRGDFRQSIAVLAPMQAEILGSLRHERLLSNPTTTSVQHLVILSRAHCMLGEFDIAQRLAAEAVQIGREVDRGFDIGFALQSLGMVALLRGDVADASVPLEEALEICQANSLESLFPLVASPLGLAYSALERPIVGRRLLDEARTAARQARLEFYHAWCTALLARAALHSGPAADTLVAVRESLAVACNNKYRWLEAWLRHALGSLLAHDAPTEALQQIEIAARLSADLAMLPDVALCDWARAELFAGSGREAQADQHRSAALRRLRELGMGALPQGAGRERNQQTPLAHSMRVS